MVNMIVRTIQQGGEEKKEESDDSNAKENAALLGSISLEVDNSESQSGTISASSHIGGEDTNEDDDNESMMSYQSKLTIDAIRKERDRQQCRISTLKETLESPSIGSIHTNRLKSNITVSSEDGEVPDVSVPAPVPAFALDKHTTGNKVFPMEEDDFARHLDVPIATFIRDVEEEVLKAGHENKGFLSFRNGFLPMLYPEQELPEKFKAWDEMGKNLATMMSDLTLRPFVEIELPILSATSYDLEDRYLFRAALLLGLSAHGYWYCGPKEPDELPPSLKEPWDEINRRLGRKGSYLSGEDVQLYNFNYLNEEAEMTRSGHTFNCQSANFKIEKLCMLQSMWGNKAEVVFHLAFCEMAKAAAPLLRLMALAQDAAERKDDVAMLSVLQSMAVSIEHIQAAFMKIIPDPNATLGIEPLVWAKTVAPVGVSFNKGMPSPSGLGTPFFHCLDVFFSRGSYSSTLGKDSMGARAFFPENWSGLLNAISSTSIYVYVVSSDNEELYSAWSQTIDVYASWNGLLGKHLQKTYNFLELAFKTGREKTLGGFQGGFSERMWDKVMDMLDRSREERMAGKNATLKLPLASLTSIEGEGGTKTLTYKMPHDAFDWRPGDVLSTWPSNPDSMVERVLEAMGANGDELVVLTEEWRLHLKQFIQLGMRTSTRHPTRAKIRDLVRFATLTPVPSKTFRYLGSFFPDVAYRRNINDALSEVPRLFGLIQFLHGDNALRVEIDGSMPNLRLLDVDMLYEQFITDESAEPMVEDVVSTLKAIGIGDIPIFKDRVVDFHLFEQQVYPIFKKLLHHSERSTDVSQIAKIFCPLKPRQYSIANMRNEQDLCIKLIISKLSYKKIRESRTGAQMLKGGTFHGSGKLQQKYFEKWKAHAFDIEKKQSLKSPNISSHSFHALETINYDYQDERKVNGVASNYLTDGGDLMFTIKSNLSFHAPPASEPILMVAAGSGISPFLGFIEERLAKRSYAETVLLWSIPYIREGRHILNDIERILKESNASMTIIVSVSREDKWPVLRDGKFHMESMPRSRITEFLERNLSLREQLHRLLLPKKYNGNGGFTYLCGSASFVRSALDVVSGVLTDATLFQDSTMRSSLLSDSCGKKSKQWLIQELQSDEKIVYEVFNDKSSIDIPNFLISELVTKNDPENNHGLWISIYDQIYDITDFVHPGGQRILHGYCGMDATVAWEAVRHHKSQSLNAKLATLLVGKLRVPSFPPLPLFSLDDDSSTDFIGVFDAWRKFIFDVVEVENAMIMEYSLDKLHIAGNSSADDLTPMKIQMLFQAHRRFVFTHLGGSVKKAKADAMRYAEALKHPQDCKNKHTIDHDQGLHPTSAKVVLQDMLASESTPKVLAACDLFIRACHGIKNSYHGKETKEYLIISAGVMKRNDLALLRKLKNTLRMVMMYLEERDSRNICIPNLYYELQRAADTIMLDWRAYVKTISSPLVLDKLWNIMDISHNSDAYLGKYDARDWLTETPQKIERFSGWQGGLKK